MNVSPVPPMQAPAVSKATWAASEKFRTFATAFAIAGTLAYVAGIFIRFTPFTIHPAVGLFEWGLQPPRSGQGPVMYWYGWVVVEVVIGGVAGLLATYLPQRITQRIPLDLVWLLPALAIPPLVWTLMPFFLK